MASGEGAKLGGECDRMERIWKITCKALALAIRIEVMSVLESSARNSNSDEERTWNLAKTR